MCGIVGIFAYTDRGRERIARLPFALQTLMQRGPDAQNTYGTENYALGHARLSIIDTSNAANQPFIDPTGRYVLVFNGEIFNYQELRKEKLKDLELKTSSDTEVLLHLLIRYGTDCLQDLQGFFAFCLYDTLLQKALLARDRYGKKPLVFYNDTDCFVFASQIKTIEAFNLPFNLSQNTVYQYFRYSYNPSNIDTIYNEVHKLSPGSLMHVDMKSGHMSQQQWYHLPTPPLVNDNAFSYKEAQSQLVDLLDLAVQDRMVADVPLGAFLSGGTDSSAVVALASRHTQRLKTFSIGYDDAPFLDESPYADLVAKQFKTEHHKFVINNKVLLDNLLPMLEALDEPFADSSALALYVLAQHTRKHVTVALTGDGADELFAGYQKYLGHFKLQNPGVLLSQMVYFQNIVGLLPKSRNGLLSNKIRQLQKFIEGLKLDPHERFLRYCSVNTSTGLGQLFHNKFKNNLLWSEIDTLEQKLSHRNVEINDVNGILWRDQQMVLPNDMLVKVDLMSMANSLEARSPFMDHRVVAFANQLPQAYKIDGHMKKKVVQDAFKDLLPAALYNRPKKGFDVPMIPWFRKELKAYIFEDLLSKEYLEQQQIFDYKHIEKLKMKLFSNDIADVQAQLWALVVFQHWYKKRNG